MIHQPIQVSIETYVISRAYGPYCCKITVTRRDRIDAVTVGHTPRELSWFVYYCFTVANIQYRVSPIPEGGGGGGGWGWLEIPIQMTFSHTSKPIVEKMKLLVKSQLVKTDQVFCLEDDEENPDDDERYHS